MARPFIAIDEEELEKLAGMCCTMNEMAAFFNCSVDTLERNYADIIKRGRNKGKMSIRREQYAAAMNGNVTMLTWLGKQLLGQHDRTQLALEKIPDEVFAVEVQRRLADGKGSSANPTQSESQKIDKGAMVQIQLNAFPPLLNGENNGVPKVTPNSRIVFNWI